MKISAKARYGLASAVYMAMQENPQASMTITTISATLGISKIYLEQTFSLLRRAGVLISIKGAQGGYLLARPPHQITVLEVLSTLDNSLVEQTEPTVTELMPDLDAAMQELAFVPAQNALSGVLSGVTLEDLAKDVQQRQNDSSLIFYI